jgi:hypothetical protein
MEKFEKKSTAEKINEKENKGADPKNYREDHLGDLVGSDWTLRSANKKLSVQSVNKLKDKIFNEIRKEATVLGEEHKSFEQLVERVSFLSQKAIEYKDRIALIKSELKGLKGSLMDAMEAGDKEAEAVLVKISEKSNLINGLEEGLEHIGGVLIPDAKAQVDQAKRGLKQKVALALSNVREKYNNILETNITEGIELPVTAWGLAQKQFFEGFGIHPGRTDLKINFNRILNGLMRPPGTSTR